MTTVSHVADQDPRGYLFARRDQGRVFRRAMRHSRIVRVLRVAMPVAIGLGCAIVFVVFALFDPWQELNRSASMAGVVVSGTKITMQQPRVGGFTKDKRPYTVTARSAAQDVTNPDVLELNDVRAVVSTLDQGDIELLATGGVYDGKTEKLSLKQGIVVRSPSYVARLKEAQVGVKSGHVVSEQPVEVEMMQGMINANRLEVVNSGEVLLFDGGVTMVLDKDDKGGGNAAGGAQKKAGAR